MENKENFDLMEHNEKLNQVRSDFPFLKNKINGKEIIYLDSGATSQKPIDVIDGVSDFIKNSYANPHRGSYSLSAMATQRFEDVREKTRKFIGANSFREIVFTKNSTESFNLLAYSYGLEKLKEGDEIVISIAEHHANLVPWQYVAKKTKAKLAYMYTDEDGRILESEYKKITKNAKIVSVTHVSNVSGVINDLKKIAKIAHEVGAIFIADGSQAVPHMRVDVKDLEVDAYIFTGHKMLSFGGVGVLYCKEKILEEMKPFLYGGDMIEYVTEQETTFNDIPYKFEAGTPALESVISLGLAMDYIDKIGYDFIEKQDRILSHHLINRLKELPYIKIIGSLNPDYRTGLVTFTMDDVHSHDVSSVLDSYGVCVRSGHHCAQPFGKYCKAQSSTRISTYFYNTVEEIDEAIEALKKVRGVLGYGT